MDERTPLISYSIFNVFCEMEDINKEIILGEGVIRFEINGVVECIPYKSIIEIVCFKMWPGFSKHPDILYIAAGPRIYWFSGKETLDIWRKLKGYETPDIPQKNSKRLRELDTSVKRFLRKFSQSSSSG